VQEEELRLSGEYKYSHLSEDLHVEIQTFAPPAEAHARIAYALAEVRRFLVPVSGFIKFNEKYETLRGDFFMKYKSLAQKHIIFKLKKIIKPSK
jgi:hypothetical protein